MRKPSWGVLFDWDGVIIDSSAFHERSWELVAGREGLVLPPDHFHRGFGKRNEEIIPEMLQWASDPAEVRRLADAKEEAYRDLIRAGGIRPLPGVAVWLDRLEAAGVPFAVGSSTPRENIDCVLALWGWEGRFAAVVASADVVRGKPDPEVFLKAAAAIGVSPSRAVVFEDAPMGVEAGLAAGARVVAVAGTHPVATFPHAHRVVRRMDELQVPELAAWFPAPMRQASGLIRGPGFGNLAKRSTPMREWTKIVLTEDEMPRQWYNIQADLSHPLPPPVDKEGNPIGPDALAPVFPMNLIEQEMSTERWIDIPEPVLEILSLWRPSPLYRARRLEKALGTPAKIYYKNEGVSPPGSHKPNTAVVQAYYNKEFGIKRLTTETGAGQWGSALAMGCKLVGLECKVYMVRISFDQKPFRKIMMQTWGADCVASPSEQTAVGRRILQEMPDTPGSLGIAISEAIEDAVTSKDTRYSLGSVLNHVLMHQTIIGLEAKKQLEKIGVYPDVVIGCAGGGSNFAGLAFPFVADKMTGREIRVIATEPTACPTLTRSPFVYDSGDVAMMTPLLAMHSLGHTFVAAPIHAGGLRYHGIAPLVSHVLRENLIEASALDQLECYQAAVLFAHTEGFIPAPETSHAIAQTIREARQAKEEGKEKVILMNWSGHGLMDLTGYQAYFEGKLSDYVLPEELMQKSLASLEGLPKPPPLAP